MGLLHFGVIKKTIQLNIIKKIPGEDPIVFKSSHDMVQSIGKPSFSLKQLSDGMILKNIYISHNVNPQIKKNAGFVKKN